MKKWLKCLFAGIAIAIVASVSFNYISDINDRINTSERQNELYKSNIEYLDSLYSNQKDSIDIYNEKIDNKNEIIKGLEAYKDSIDNVYENDSSDLDSMSVDSLVSYIINNFKGKQYDIINTDSSTLFIAFTDTTIRDVVGKDLERKYLLDKEVFYNDKIDSQEDIINYQLVKMSKLQEQLHIRKKQVDNLKTQSSIKQDFIDELQRELNKSNKKAKILEYVTYGTTGLALIAVIF